MSSSRIPKRVTSSPSRNTGGERRSRGTRPERALNNIDNVPEPGQAEIRNLSDSNGHGVAPEPERAEEVLQNERGRSPSPSGNSETSEELEWDPAADIGSLATSKNDGSTAIAKPGAGHQTSKAYSSGASILNRIALQLSSGSSGASKIDDQMEPPFHTSLSTTASGGSNSSSLLSPPGQNREFRQDRHAQALPDADGPRPPQTTATADAENKESSRVHAQRLHSGMSRSMIELAAEGTKVRGQSGPHHHSTLLRDLQSSPTPRRTLEETNVTKSTIGTESELSGPNESSSLYDWQTSGETKSEIKYKNRKMKAGHATTDDDKSGLYTVTVEVQSDSDLQGELKSVIPGKKRSDRSAGALFVRNRGVQTEFPIEKVPSSKSKKREPDDSIRKISRSIQTQDDMIQLAERASLGSTDNNRKSGGIVHQGTSGSKTYRNTNIRHHESTTDANGRYRSGNYDEENEDEENRSRKRDKGKGYPKTKSSEQEVQSLLEEYLDSGEEQLDFGDDDHSPSSTMSETCMKIHEILKKRPLRGKLLELVAAHQLSLGQALKAHIRHIRQLNKIVLDARDFEQNNRSSSSTDQELIEEYFKQLEQAIPRKLERNFTTQQNEFYKIPEAKSPPVEPRALKRNHRRTQGEPLRPLTQLSSYSNPNSNSKAAAVEDSPDENTKAMVYVSKSPKKMSASTHVARVTRTRVPTPSDKLDSLQRACDIILDLLLLQQGVHPLPIVSNGELQMQTNDERMDQYYCTEGQYSLGTQQQNNQTHSVVKSSQKKQPLSFFVSFPNCKPCNGIGSTLPVTVECPEKTLQEAFQKNHPDVIARVKAREEIIQRIKTERQSRGEHKREYIRSYTHHKGELPNSQQMLPPKGPRVMKEREMKALTKKRHQTLPEVQAKKLMAIAKQEQKTNRQLQKIYAKKLREDVLRGKVSREQSKSVIGN